MIYRDLTINTLQKRSSYESVFKECFLIIESLDTPTRDMLKRMKYSKNLIECAKNYF